MSKSAKLKGKPKRTKGVIATEKVRKRMSKFTDKERKRLHRYFAKSRKGRHLTDKEIADIRQMGKSKKPEPQSVGDDPNSFFAIRKTS